MEKNDYYFKANEENDFRLLNDFNGDSNLFSELHQTPAKHFYDVSGKTKDGRDVIIELKRRNLDWYSDSQGKWHISGITGENKEFSADDILISTHKSADILFYSLANQVIPLHITILNNAILIHDLLHQNPMPKRYASVKSYSNGYGKFEYGSKHGLHIDNAILYLKDGDKYVRRNDK